MTANGDPVDARDAPNVIPFRDRREAARSRGDAGKGARSPEGAGKMGMVLFLVSLSMLFASSLVGVIIVRFKASGWRLGEDVGIPGGLWLSTAVILASSAGIHLALQRVRAGRLDAFRRALGATFGLGVLFLALQAINWAGLIREGMTGREDLFGFSFYALTGLHALHVIGGLVHLGVVLAFARRGRYDAGNHGGVLYAAMYWHFLDAVWVILFLALLLVL